MAHRVRTATALGRPVSPHFELLADSPGYPDDVSDEGGVLGVDEVSVLVGDQGVDVAQLVHQLSGAEHGQGCLESSDLQLQVLVVLLDDKISFLHLEVDTLIQFENDWGWSS